MFASVAQGAETGWALLSAVAGDFGLTAWRPALARIFNWSVPGLLNIHPRRGVPNQMSSWCRPDAA